MFKKIDYTMIMVTDMKRSLHFYRDILGFRVRFESEFWTEFDTEGTTLALHGGAPEEFGVLVVGPGPSPLDVAHAEVVELAGDSQLVLDGERDVLALRTVPQRGVVDLDLHVFPQKRRRPSPAADG